MKACHLAGQCPCPSRVSTARRNLSSRRRQLVGRPRTEGARMFSRTENPEARCTWCHINVEYSGSQSVRREFYASGISVGKVSSCSLVNAWRCASNEGEEVTVTEGEWNIEGGGVQDKETAKGRTKTSPCRETYTQKFESSRGATVRSFAPAPRGLDPSAKDFVMSTLSLSW